MGLCGSTPVDENVPKNIYDIEVETIKGEQTTMEQYKGHVIMIVNIAGKCGFTYQLKNLEDVYKKYKDQGFVILGFPTNDFMSQEPRNKNEIAESCSLTYGVDFPLFAKIMCKGSKKHPLYKFLTNEKTNPNFCGDISWNFNKFLISKNGNVINRFGSSTKPDDEEVLKAIENALQSN